MKSSSPWKLPLIVLGGVIFCLVSLAIVQRAWADGLPSKPMTRVQAAQAAPSNPWTGCGIGAFGGFLQGALDTSSPVNVGSEGSVFGITGNCDYQNGSAVLGVFAREGWAFGDIKTLGAHTDLTLGGRAGYLVWPSTLVYGLVAWDRISAAPGNLNGYKLGGGVEINLRDSPIFWDVVRVERGFYSNALGSGLDVDTTTVTSAITWKFNWTR